MKQLKRLKKELLAEETFNVIRQSIESVVILSEKKVRKKRKKKIVRAIRRIKPLVYEKYIKSLLWRNRRFAYYKHHKKRCVICRTSQRICLHHMTYKNIGVEKDNELVALCWTCHKAYHKEYRQPSIKSTKAFIAEQRGLITSIREVEEMDNHFYQI